MDDIYRNPGPLQFDGPGAGAKVITLSVEDQDYMGRIKKLQEYLEQVLPINLVILTALEFRAYFSYSMVSEKFKFNAMSLVQDFKSSDWSSSLCAK